MFVFNRTPYLISEGYRSTLEALDALTTPLQQLTPGVYPRQEMAITVNEAECVGCGICVAREPDVFHRAENGKAWVKDQLQSWSPDLAAAIHGCPTGAIMAS